MVAELPVVADDPREEIVEDVAGAMLPDENIVEPDRNDPQ